MKLNQINNWLFIAIAVMIWIYPVEIVYYKLFVCLSSILIVLKNIDIKKLEEVKRK